MCGEMLWVDMFVLSSELFCLISLCETCLVLALSYYSEEHLLPNWLMTRKLFKAFRRTAKRTAKNTTSK
eukprot:5759891-Prymnesium_polylepis.1